MPEVVSGDVRVNRTVVRLVKGDITDLDVDAFVFYAQPDLAIGSGYGTAISVRGGPSVQKELEPLAPVSTGDAVVTAAGNLKAQYIIHAVGPRFQEEDMERKLRTTMVNALKRAEEKDLKRLAFPAMGAGYYGVPRELCATVMLDVIKTHLSGDTGIEELVIDVLDTAQYDAFDAQWSTLG